MPFNAPYNALYSLKNHFNHSYNNTYLFIEHTFRKCMKTHDKQPISDI